MQRAKKLLFCVFIDVQCGIISLSGSSTTAQLTTILHWMRVMTFAHVTWRKSGSMLTMAKNDVLSVYKIMKALYLICFIFRLFRVRV